MATKALAVQGKVRGVFFSLGTTPSADPQLNCAKAIIDLFRKSRKTAHVAIFTLTDPQIVQAMVDAHKRGLEIKIVVDAEQTRSSENPAQAKMVKRLAQAGIAVRLAKKQKALMHNKVGIFDAKTVCTGSFNWTSAAQRKNDENLIVVEGSEVVAAYEKYMFQRIWTKETKGLTF